MLQGSDNRLRRATLCILRRIILHLRIDSSDLSTSQSDQIRWNDDLLQALTYIKARFEDASFYRHNYRRVSVSLLVTHSYARPFYVRIPRNAASLVKLTVLSSMKREINHEIYF